MGVTGVVVSPEDPDELAAGLQKVIDDPEAAGRRAIAGLGKVGTEFDRAPQRQRCVRCSNVRWTRERCKPDCRLRSVGAERVIRTGLASYPLGTAHFARGARDRRPGDRQRGIRLLGEIHWGVRPRLVPAREPPQGLAWLALTLAAAAVVGAMLGRGEVKAAFVPVAALLVLLFAGVPVAGYLAILWSVGTAVDMLALPEVSVSSLQFVPAEILLWIAVGSLMFLPGDVRRGLKSLARRRESIVMGVFLAAVVGGVAVGVANGASLHAAVFDMRMMLFYAAFWPALAALDAGREWCSSWSSRVSWSWWPCRCCR